MQGADAPTRDEKIVVGIDANNPGQVTGEMWDGTSWTALPLSMGTVSENYWYGAEVAYEQHSGDAVVVWNDNSQAVGDKLRYAVWDGSTWSAPQSIGSYAGTEPQNLRLAFDPGSDTLALVVSDVTADDHVMIWDGSAWGNAVTLDTSGTAESDQSAIAVAFEAQTGDAMVAYGINGSSAVYYRIWDGASWSAQASVPAAGGVTGDAAWLVHGIRLQLRSHRAGDNDRCRRGLVERLGWHRLGVFRAGRDRYDGNGLSEPVRCLRKLDRRRAGDLWRGHQLDRQVPHLGRRRRLVGRAERARSRRCAEQHDTGQRSD